MLTSALLFCLIGAASSLRLPARGPCTPTFGAVGAARSARSALPSTVMQEAKPKGTWNTAIDEDGNTYYWNAETRQTTYDMPDDFDPATAKSAGVYKPPQTSTSNDLYDDQIPEKEQIVYTSGEKKPELSNAMRDRLINESRGLGADPNQKNPFLFVFAGVGVFVVLGALAVNI